METKFDVVFSGQLQPETTLEEAASKLIKISNMSADRAKTLLSSGKPVIMKKAAPREMAESYQQRLSNIGLQIQLVKSNQKQPSVPPAPAAEIPPLSSKKEKKAPPKLPKSPASPANLYAAPKANLTGEKQTSETFLEEPRKLKAGRGWKWITEAISLFREDPWKWLGMYIVMILITIPLSLIPLLGSILNTIIGIVFGGGLMIGANSLNEGNGLRFNHLFSGFTQNRNQLVLAGVYYLLGIIALVCTIGLFVFILMGSSFLAMIGSSGNNPEMAAAMQHNLPMLIIAILIGMALMIPLAMAIWFTSCLIAINGTKAFTAMKLSLKACMKNVLPFLVYSLGYLLVFMIGGAVFAAFSGILAFFGQQNFSFMLVFLPIIIMMLIGLPVMVIFGLSIFTGFKDIFYETK